jgi:hypothetical protein
VERCASEHKPAALQLDHPLARSVVETFLLDSTVMTPAISYTYEIKRKGRTLDKIRLEADKLAFLDIH